MYSQFTSQKVLFPVTAVLSFYYFGVFKVYVPYGMKMN